MKNGEIYRWRPGLKMDPDTDKLVELIRPVISASKPAPWKARVLDTDREITVYPDELIGAR